MSACTHLSAHLLAASRDGLHKGEIEHTWTGEAFLLVHVHLSGVRVRAHRGGRTRMQVHSRSNELNISFEHVHSYAPPFLLFFGRRRGMFAISDLFHTPVLSVGGDNRSQRVAIRFLKQLPLHLVSSNMVSVCMPPCTRILSQRSVELVLNGLCNASTQSLNAMWMVHGAWCNRA